MFETEIKPDYSEAVAQFLANGGEIKQAENTHKAEFNFSVSTGGLKQNIQLRKDAEVKGLKTYVAFAACEKCSTFERSVKSNACLECDRRRARAKTGLSVKNLEAIGRYLLDKGESVEFTSGGQTYVLKVEVA